ncbi:MAG: DUF3300 domain-containing protein [Limisphaerales bacterium]
MLADRYVSGGGDPNQIDAQPWDVSVQAVARYPTVLKYMDDNLAGRPIWVRLFSINRKQ